MTHTYMYTNIAKRKEFLSIETQHSFLRQTITSHIWSHTRTNISTQKLLTWGLELIGRETFRRQAFAKTLPGCF